MINEISQAAYLALIVLFIPIPYATNRKITVVPWVTYGILLLNLLAYAFFVFPALSSGNENALFDRWGVIPTDPRLLNLVTYLFVHVSLTHLLWNSAFLWLFGPSGEDALGHFPYLIFYIAGGVVAGLLHVAIVLLFAQSSAVAYSPMVGASGAIAAVIGLYALRFYRSNLKLVWCCASFLMLKTSRFELPAIAGLGLWFVQNLVFAIAALFQPDRNGIAYWAHIGGFVFGMAVAQIMGMLSEGIREYLFADVVTAGGRGDEGAHDAVRKFRILLQHRPDDSELREALQELNRQSKSSDSLEVRQTIGEAYAMLLEHSLLAGDRLRIEESRAAFDALDAENVISGQSLVRLASLSSRAGYPTFSAKLYDKTIEKFSGTPESMQATLDKASIILENEESPAEAIKLVTKIVIGG